MKTPQSGRRFLAGCLVLTAALAAGAASQLVGDCGPFTDVTFFCSPILELYYLGITSGTSPTTYAPDQTTTRGEIAAFISRSFNQTMKRTSRRAALGQWWTPRGPEALGLTTVGVNPAAVAFDGADLWVANSGDGTVSRVRASDGKLLETWTGAAGASSVLVAMGRIFVAGDQSLKGALYTLDPSQPAGTVTTVVDGLDWPANGLAFDGSRIWMTLEFFSISIVTPGASFPWSATTVGGGGGPVGILFDGANIWVSDAPAGVLRKLDSSGTVLQTVAVGTYAGAPIFDGANIWIPTKVAGPVFPNSKDSVSVVRASTGAVLATLTGNGLDGPGVAAFDGERVLVVNGNASTISLWRAADLAPLGSVSTGASTGPAGACSDGVNFWIALSGTFQLARF